MLEGRIVQGDRRRWKSCAADGARVVDRDEVAVAVVAGALAFWKLKLLFTLVFFVLLAILIAAVLATVVDVTVRGKDPAEETVPAILFSAQDAE